METVPPQFRERLLYRHNPNVTLMRTTADEMTRIGRFIAEKLNRMQGPVREIMSSKVALDTLGASVADVAEYLEATKTPHIKSGTKRLPGFEATIEFRDVSFRYAPHEPLALDRVSFTIPMGRTTAIVGRS